MWNLLEAVLVSILSFLGMALAPIVPFLEYLTEEGFRELFVLGTSYAAILSGIILLFHLCCKSFIAPRYFKFMWIMIGLRLIIPFVPESELSLFNVFNEDPKIVHAEPFETDPDRTLSAYTVPGSPFPVLEPALTHSANILDQSNNTLAMTIVFSIYIWFIGCLFFLIQPVVANWRMNRRFRMTNPTIDKRLNHLLTEIQTKMNCQRWVPILVTDDIPFPALMGMSYPTILLPKDIAETYSDEELSVIFAHELAHMKRRDIALNWGLALIRVIQWINPLFWFISSKIKKFGELTCDADVLKTLGADKFRIYGDTLIKVAQRNPNCKRTGLIAPVGLTGILSQKKNHSFLKQRIKQLKYSKQPQTKKLTILSWAVVTSFLFLGMTNSAEKEIDPDAVQAFKKQSELENQNIAIPVALIPKVKKVEEQDIAKTKVEETGLRTVIVYPVADLLRKPKGNGKENIEKLCSYLKSVIDIKDPSRIVSYKKDEQLVIYATHEEHKKSADQLQHWRKNGWGEISVEIRIATVSEYRHFDMKNNFGDNLQQNLLFKPSQLSDLKPLSAIVNKKSQPYTDPISISTQHLSPKWVSRLTPHQTFLFIQNAQHDNGVNILCAPEVTCISGQSCIVASEYWKPFVVGIQAGRDKNNKPINVPTLKKLPDGNSFSMHLSPSFNRSNNQITLEYAFIKNGVTKVFTRKLNPSEIPVPSTKKNLTVQVPQVESLILQGQVQIKHDHSIMIATGIKPNSSYLQNEKKNENKLKEELYLVLKCKVVDEP